MALANTTQPTYKKNKASILIIVVMVMIISTFLVLVTMRYFAHMLGSFQVLTNYYKSYYLARGSMDVLLTQQSYRGWWYELASQEMSTGFSCIDCGVTGSIQSRFPRVDASTSPQTSQCSKDTAIILSWWQTAVFAMFGDNGGDGESAFKSPNPNNYQPLQQTTKNLNLQIYPQDPNSFFGKIYVYDWEITESTPFGNIVTSWGFSKAYNPGISMENIIENIQDRWSYILSNFYQGKPIKNTYYIIVANPQAGDVADGNNPPPAVPFGICFTSSTSNQWSQEDVWLVWLTAILRADAHVADSYVTLETIKTNRFPSFLVQ